MKFSEFKKLMKMVNKRYQFCCPWREENPDLPENYNSTYGKLNSVVERLRKNPEILKMYDNVIKD